MGGCEKSCTRSAEGAGGALLCKIFCPCKKKGFAMRTPKSGGAEEN